MRKSAVQISLWDIYNGVSEAIEQHKPQLIRLLEEHIDFDRLIALSFSYENNTSLVCIMPREACALGAPYGSYLPGNRLLAYTEDGLNARSNGHADGE